MIMDWREMAGRPTSFRGVKGEERWESLKGVWSSGQRIGVGSWTEEQWIARNDPVRGWVIAFCWMLASGVEYVDYTNPLRPELTQLINSIYYLYALIRRPRMILDFSLTLLFNHLVLTTYYSASIPTSLFFWIVMGAGAALMIIVAEQLCVKREMNEGLSVNLPRREDEDVEMGGLLNDERERSRDRRRD
jgi:protein SYS1